MEITEHNAGQVTVLVINGRIDSSNAIDLSNKLRTLYATPGRRLLLDLQELEYISSAGFRTLLIALRRAAETGDRLALRLGPVGSGYLCPPIFAAAYLPASLLALQAGGESARDW